MPDVTIAHDRLGRQVRISDGTGGRTNVYDASTLDLIEERLPDGSVLARSQDSFGRASGIVVAGGGDPGHMARAADLIESHIAGILAHWDQGVTNAFMEGLNSE